MSFVGLPSAADEERATQAACGLVREKLTLLLQRAEVRSVSVQPHLALAMMRSGRRVLCLSVLRRGIPRKQVQDLEKTRSRI